MIFKELQGQIRSLLPQLRIWAENPRLLGTVLEERSPWLSRQFLSVASNISEPFVAGMGLVITEMSEEVVRVRIPHRWKNLDEAGELHPAALVTAAEFASRAFWSRHLDLRVSELRLNRCELQVMKAATESASATMVVTPSERESLMYRLRSEGAVVADSMVSIYDSRGQMIAQVLLEWSIQKVKTLSSGAAQNS